MDTTRRATEFVPTFEPQPAATALPGVYGITAPNGTVTYVYAASAEEAAARAAEQTPAPVVQPITPASTAPAVVERPQLIEPWMVRGAAGLGLAGGAVALAPVAASVATALSAAVGDIVQVALQIGGAAFAALVLVHLLGGRKSGGGKILEVIQTVEQTITNTVRIEK